MKHDGRVCECGRPVKISQSTGRNKGYYRTCGRKDCVFKGIRSERAKEARKASLTERMCQHCSKAYKPTSSVQRWCTTCCPNKNARARMQRYSISEPEYQAMLREQGELCALCKKVFPSCVDHDHENNRTRKLLCGACNLKLSAVEDKEWLERAMAYIILFK